VVKPEPPGLATLAYAPRGGARPPDAVAGC
jgi:hypothetical protein